jgi:REP element-mobilizing transposase RayT
MVRIQNRERRRRLERYLDAGYGECLLARPSLAKLVEAALRFFHGGRYLLRAWVVMPNHVHAMLVVWDAPLGQIVGGWKSCTARRINECLGRSGVVWARDYWDSYIRDAAHEVRACRYIELNPFKAGLASDPSQWSWSSARYRDAYGRLVLD